MTSSLPVWVGDQQRWVTGLGRKTTCEEVVAVLLRGEGCAVDDQGGYTIVERWRRMERPLDSKTKILKVWRAWGDTQNEVKLTLRRVDGEADSGRGSPSPSSTHRRRRHRNKPPWPSHHETLHPRRLAQQLRANSPDSRRVPESIERLMKLILAQGETIQSQLRRLRDRENQIEHFEEETHRARVQSLGSNYLLDTYLAVEVGEEKENDSGVLTGESDQTSPVSEGRRRDGDDDDDDSDVAAVQDLQARVEVWERLAKVNRRLEREEENLVRIHKKIQRYHQKIEARGGDRESSRTREALLLELDKVHADLERGTRELEHNSLALAESEALLDARRHYLRRLQVEVDATDRETIRLQEIVNVQNSRLESVIVPNSRQEIVNMQNSRLEGVNVQSSRQDNMQNSRQDIVNMQNLRQDDANVQNSRQESVNVQNSRQDSVQNSRQESANVHNLRQESVNVQNSKQVIVNMQNSRQDNVNVQDSRKVGGVNVGAPRGILKKTGHTITTVAVIHNDTDSNSDTGLSSLHSSSEEGVYTLDTLV